MIELRRDWKSRCYPIQGGIYVAPILKLGEQAEEKMR
jgi:hypothetical protein